MPRRYSMDTRSSATAATRSRVLDAGLEILAEVGAGALTMQAVAERADVALRTLYNHFASKEELAVEAYSRLATATQDAVRDLPKTGTPREDLVAWVDAFFDTFEDQGTGAAAILSVTGVPEFEKMLSAVRAWRRRELTTILRGAQLRVPLKQAVAVAFLWTAYATWHSLSEESGLGPAGAKAVTLDALDTLFEEKAPL